MRKRTNGRRCIIDCIDDVCVLLYGLSERITAQLDTVVVTCTYPDTPHIHSFMQSLRHFRLLRNSLNLKTYIQTSLPQTAQFSTCIRAMAQEFKLKGVTSLNLKNGDKQEVEVEGVEGGKVLLLKVQDKVHATSANCTYYR
jgi:hypothetical protein